MNGKAKKIITASALAAVGITGVFAASHALTYYMMRIALDRIEPKVMTRAKAQLMGSKENQALLTRLRVASAALEERVSEEVEIIAHDGIKLVGHYWPCDNAKRTVVAMHGWRSSWSMDFGAIADFWHENGCNILFAEQRGQNKSGGEYMGFGLMERYDCRRWVEWVNANGSAFLPVYLGGISMGATTVLMAAGLNLPPNVVGIVADCGFTSPQAIWQHVAEDNLHISYGIRRAAADDLCRKRIKVGAGSYSTTEALKNTDIPVLLVHGTDDRFVPIEMTYENYKACASPKRLLVVPGAEHGTSYLVDREQYEEKILSFWRDYDLTRREMQEETESNAADEENAKNDSGGFRA